MGALFAVYWLARLELPEVRGSAGMDGQRGFCFGVDGRWAPPSDAEVQAISRKLASGRGAVPETAAQKQAAFLKAMDWGGVHELLVDAAVLCCMSGLRTRRAKPSPGPALGVRGTRTFRSCCVLPAKG